jgi:hypothetical protein
MRLIQYAIISTTWGLNVQRLHNEINGHGVNRSILIFLSVIIHEWNKQLGLLTMKKLKWGVGGWWGVVI